MATTSAIQRRPALDGDINRVYTIAKEPKDLTLSHITPWTLYNTKFDSFDTYLLVIAFRKYFGRDLAA